MARDFANAQVGRSLPSWMNCLGWSADSRGSVELTSDQQFTMALGLVLAVDVDCLYPNLSRRVVFDDPAPVARYARTIKVRTITRWCCAGCFAAPFPTTFGWVHRRDNQSSLWKIVAHQSNDLKGLRQKFPQQTGEELAPSNRHCAKQAKTAWV